MSTLLNSRKRLINKFTNTFQKKKNLLIILQCIGEHLSNLEQPFKKIKITLNNLLKLESPKFAHLRCLKYQQDAAKNYDKFFLKFCLCVCDSW